MTRYLSPARALHQVGRHRSGTPNAVPPAPPSWAANLAAFNAAASISSARILAGLDHLAASLRSKQETT